MEPGKLKGVCRALRSWISLIVNSDIRDSQSQLGVSELTERDDVMADIEQFLTNR